MARVSIVVISSVSPTASASTPVARVAAVALADSELSESLASAADPVHIADYVIVTVDETVDSTTPSLDGPADLEMDIRSTANKLLVLVSSNLATFCVAWVVGQAFLLDEKRLQNPYYKSVSVLVIVHCFLHVGNMLPSGRYPIPARVFKVLQLLSVLAAFFFAAAMHLYLG